LPGLFSTYSFLDLINLDVHKKSTILQEKEEEESARQMKIIAGIFCVPKKKHQKLVWAQDRGYDGLLL
jgi:hypothetical protein